MSIIERLPPDVWQEIGHVTLDLRSCPYRSIGRKTLIALAATCQYLYEPALNVLYRVIPDIAVLFYSLPDELYKRERIVLNTGGSMGAQFYEEVITFAFTCDNLDQADLVRFFAHARRVKAIVDTCEYYAKSPVRSTLVAVHTVYTTLARVLAASPLCPSLGRLHYSRNELTPFSVFRGLHILFGPSLKHFFVTSSEESGHNSRRRHHLPEALYTRSDPAEDEDTFYDMQAKLRKLSPRLQSSYVLMEPSTSSMTSATRAAIYDFRQLVVLDYHAALFDSCYYASPTFIAHCAQLPCLRELRTGIDDRSWPPDWRLQITCRQSHTSPNFPCLRQLNLIGRTLAFLTDLLPFMGCPILEDLSIYTNGNMSRDEIRPFFASVAALSTQTTLRSLYLLATKPVISSTRTSSGCDRHSSPIDAETLDPLFVLSQMQRFMLALRCPYDIDDALLQRIGMAWPELTRLEFMRNRRDNPNPGQWWCTNCQSDQPGIYRLGRNEVDGGEYDFEVGPPKDMWCRPRATLLGLFYLAHHCPNISQMTFPIDANISIIPPARALESTVERRAKLRTLSLDYSPIEDPYAVAAFLTGLFRIDSATDIRTFWADDGSSFTDGDLHGAELEDGTGREWWQKPVKYGKGWRTVMRIIRTFEKVRLEERRWGW
ncbi:hypothetical protein GY45DRAFT_1316398 [Cubamyces sp. BRFM 1775]|nr:hypothetical protein GY45DRAFT_1316398 [Cubamyces sp. BRFM 1775]